MRFTALLNAQNGTPVGERTIEVDGHPQEVVVLSQRPESALPRVFVKHAEEPGFPFAPGARLIYREVRAAFA